MTADSVYGILKAYTDDDDWFGSDNILEQIATEYGPEKAEKKKLIDHIIKCVLEFGKKYGTDNKDSYTELYDNYCNGISEDKANDSSECRKIDHLILDILGIDNY